MYWLKLISIKFKYALKIHKANYYAFKATWYSKRKNINKAYPKYCKAINKLLAMEIKSERSE